MGEQLELFETGKSRWRKKVDQPIPPETRREVIRVLGRMGANALQAARGAQKEQRKEGGNES